MNLKEIWSENIFFLSDQERPRRESASLDRAFSWLGGLGPSFEDDGSRESLGEGYEWKQSRMLAVVCVFLFSFLFLFGRLFQLEVVWGDRYRVLSEENRYRRQVVRPPRGIIYDRHGAPLVENKPSFRLLWDSKVPGIGSREEALGSVDWEGLATVLQWGEEKLRKVRSEARESENPVVLAGGLSRSQVVGLEVSYVSPALKTEVMPVRSYPYGETFAHVLGYTGEASPEEIAQSDQVTFGSRAGKAGLEKEFDLLLRGRAGERILEVDVGGASLKEREKREAVQGQVLRTSLDLELQKIASAALSAAVEESSASGGAVVAQDPRSGQILALTSYPGFDPNSFVGRMESASFEKLKNDARKPLFSRALSGSYPPGSIFKPIIAAAALEEGIVTPERIVDCKGAISVGSFVFRDWKLSGHGNVSLVEGLAKSCDVYFYTLGGGYGGVKGLGPERIADWTRKFGLGSVLGVDFPWEAQGLVPDPQWKEEVKGEQWYLGNTYHLSIGQGDLLVTPLQINNALSAIVNGGTLYRPSFLLGQEAEVIGEDLVSRGTVGWVKKGLEQVCQPGGTAYHFFDFPVPVGGKTGTAETGRGDNTHAWFTVFAPLEEPEIVLTVFLENGGSGSHDAAPIAREIMDWYGEYRLDVDIDK